MAVLAVAGAREARVLVVVRQMGAEEGGHGVHSGEPNNDNPNVKQYVWRATVMPVQRNAGVLLRV